MKRMKIIDGLQLLGLSPESEIVEECALVPDGEGKAFLMMRVGAEHPVKFAVSWEKNMEAVRKIGVQALCVKCELMTMKGGD